MLDLIEWLSQCESDTPGWIRFAGSWYWVLVARVGVFECCKYSSTVLVLYRALSKGLWDEHQWERENTAGLSTPYRSWRFCAM